MKHLSTLLLCVLFSLSIAYSQTTLYSENFESGTAGSFTLNTSDVSSNPSGTNFWIVNNFYTGGSGSLICFGFPFSYTINPTPSQPAPITNFPNSYYLHTMSQYGQADNIFCSSFAASDGLCIFDDNVFSRMTNDISTVGYTGVNFSFYWTCGGGTNIHGEVYYSTNAGGSWTQCTTPITQYKNQLSWTQTTITMPAFDNQTTLRFGFRFVNMQSSSAVDPGFSIDDIVLSGTLGGGPSITTGAVSGGYCAGANLVLPYTISGTFTGGNTFTAQLSDGAGSFASPTNIGSVVSTSAGNINCVIPPGTPAGSGYMIRVVSSTPAVTGSSSSAFSVYTLPTANGSNTGPYCQGDTVFLMSSGGVSSAWGGPAGFSSGNQNPTIPNCIPANGGSYTVTVTDVNGCTGSTVTSVTVNAAPNASASNTGPYCEPATIMLSATGGTDYDWTGPAGYNQPNTQNPGIASGTTANSGAYTVTVTDANGCSTNVTTTVSVLDCSGIEDEELAQVNVYPNPVSDVFTIVVSENMVGNSQLSVMNMVGEFVYTAPVNQLKTMISTQSLGLRAGIYLVKIKYKDQFKTIRLVVR